MITARNYAAQAEQSLDNGCLLVDFKGDGSAESDFAAIKKLIKQTIKGTHFVLPDGGHLLDDEWKGLWGKTVPNLPYSDITIEYYDCPHKILIMAAQDGPGERIYLNVCKFSLPHQKWIFVPAFAVIMAETEVGSDGRVDFGIFANTDQEIVEMNPDIAELLSYAIDPCMELLEALSCRNVTTANYQDASPKNAKRIKEGKLPIYETKMLVVDTKASITAKGEYQGGSHASPRQHLRRGHIRRHPSAGNIWVQSCVVGDPTKGSINKSYTVI